MGKIEVGIMREADLPEILALYQQLIGRMESLSETQKRWREMEKDPRCRIFVAREESGKICGTAMCYSCPSLTEEGRPFLVVENVVVSEECRGMGVGKLLFEEIDRFAEENRCSYSILVSSEHRSGAHRFYKKIGYSDPVKGFRKLYHFE